MAQRIDKRSRFVTPDLKRLWREGEHSTLNKEAHESDHTYSVLVYTSPKTLTTNAGTELYSPVAGRLAWMYVSVAGAPTSTMKVDLLISAASVFDGTNYATIASGDKSGFRQIPLKLSVVPVWAGGGQAATPLTVQINTLAAATGPMLAYVGIQRAEL